MTGHQMWRVLKRGHVIKEVYFSPRHTDNSDEVSDEESQASNTFHCTSATKDTQKKKSIFTMKTTYQWALHRLVIQAVLFLHATSVANDLQTQQWLQPN
jgi:hypothetical protein